MLAYAKASSPSTTRPSSATCLPAHKRRVGFANVPIGRASVRESAAILLQVQPMNREWSSHQHRQRLRDAPREAVGCIAGALAKISRHSQHNQSLPPRIRRDHSLSSPPVLASLDRCTDLLLKTRLRSPCQPSAALSANCRRGSASSND
jgi:hypothetical protein